MACAIHNMILSWKFYPNFSATMSQISELSIEVQPREERGRQACKQLRAQGRIPAVLYGKDLNKTYSIDEKEIRNLLRKVSGTTSLLQLKEGNSEEQLVLIKDMEINRVSDDILHVDFLQITRGEDMHAKVPLSLIGEAEGVRTHGGILEVVANDIEIRCRPSKLPSVVELDISNLGLSENLQIKDLPEIDGVEYTSSSDTILVSCVGSAKGRSGADEDDISEDEIETPVEETSEEVEAEE